MAININKYINITSSVGGASILRTRELLGRFYTINPLLPTNSILEFTNKDDVGTYFGFTSEEYLRAQKYFGFVGKNGTSPQKCSYSRWTNANTAPMIFGGSGIATLTALQLVTTGAFSMTLGGVTNVVSGLNFSAAASLSDVAAAIQVGIRTKTGTQWTAATVTYNSTKGSFNFVGGDNSVVANVTVAAPGSGTDITTMIRWLQAVGPTGAIWSNGALIETLTEALTDSSAASDNFGSFIFMSSLNLNQSQLTEIATWNDSENVKYQYCAPVTASTATAISGALIDLSGTAMNLSPISTEYPDQDNMNILASIDFTQKNSTVNFMYTPFDSQTPSVTDTATANAYDALRVNYYGQTQSAGQNKSFYQRGFLTGDPSVDPIDMATYAGEQWAKARATSALMDLLLAEPEISANANGVGTILTTLQSTVVAEGLDNGVITTGKAFTNEQKAFITGITGIADAWRQVQNLGYWLSCVIVPILGTALVTEYEAQYTLIYSKNDVVRSVRGRHILI